MKLVTIVAVVCAFLGRSEGGGGPIDVPPLGITAPNFFAGGEIANDAPPGPFFADFSPPFPTDAWWSGYTVGTQDAAVAGPFPFQSSTSNIGFRFGMGDTRNFDGTSIKVPTQMDWTATLTGLPDNVNNRKCTSFDTQTVCLQYSNGAGATFDTCAVPGSAYVTFVYKNAAIVLNSDGGDITDFHWVTPGKKASVTSTYGGTYLIYIIEGTADLTLQADENKITSPAGTTATLRFAKLKVASQEDILDAHQNTYPTGLDYKYTVAGDIATQTWTWDVVGDPNKLLILSWPHHREVLQGANYVNIEYLTLKGVMRGVSGNVWTQRYELPTISWFSEDPIHPSCLAELEKTLESDVNKLKEMVPGDFYFWGGAFGRASRFALIAEQINRPDLIEKVLTVLKASVSHWFDPAHEPHAAYETGWGGFINKEGWNNSWVDFGNAYYNDHHFHYGYLMQGAGTIGKYDKAWLTEHADFFIHVARNTGNPSPNDPHYTVTRHMDFFAGHSWASGIHNGAGPRDQESSGEAINGYYGLLLLATALENQVMIDWARLLLAIEIKGAQQYWHLYPNAPADATPYPEQAFRDLITVGNVMDAQAGAWLFWGGQRIQISAIQILPLTPIGQVNFDKEWMEGVLPYCMDELMDYTLEDGFKCVIYAAYAKVNPVQAYEYSKELIDWGSGNSASNQLYFIATQPSTVDICSVGAQQPEGLYNIQDVASGLFVTVTGGGILSATTTVDVLAAKFVLGFTPGGGTIQSLSSEKYVSASPDSSQALSASRDTFGSYEVFRWAVQPDGNYHLTTMVNRHQVTSGPTGLINNANATNGVAPASYKLVPAEDLPPVALPATAVIQSVENNRFVVSTAEAPTLLTTASAAGAATRFAFAIVEDSPASAPYYTIQNVATEKYVTGNADGTIALIANSGMPQAWEHFQIVPYQGSYIVLHVASGMPVAAQPDDTLQDNATAINSASLWKITA